MELQETAISLTVVVECLPDTCVSVSIEGFWLVVIYSSAGFQNTRIVLHHISPTTNQVLLVLRTPSMVYYWNPNIRRNVIHPAETPVIHSDTSSSV